MRAHKRHKDSGRDPGGFIALPWSVMDSPGYLGLSMHARALLLEIARQYTRDNNGQLLLSRAFLEPRGWRSNDMITKAKRELLDGGFIYETVRGCRPHKASWYAVTWQALDKHPMFDPGAFEGFRKAAYRALPVPSKPTRESTYRKWDSQLKIDPLTPPHGVEPRQIAPPHGTGAVPIAPPHGAIQGVFGPLSVPPHGHHLDMPSPGGGTPWAETMGGGRAAQVGRPNEAAEL